MVLEWTRNFEYRAHVSKAMLLSHSFLLVCHLDLFQPMLHQFLNFHFLLRHSWDLFAPAACRAEHYCVSVTIASERVT